MIKFIFYVLLVATLSNCSSNKVNTRLVYMSTTKVPKNCKFLGYIYGPHETFTTGNNPKLGKNLSQVHIEKAKELRANYIEMNELEDMGKAYSCPYSELSNMTPY